MDDVSEGLDPVFEPLLESGRTVEFQVEGEERAVSMVLGKAGGCCLVFDRPELRTEVLLSQTGLEALIHLLLGGVSDGCA